MQPDNTGNQQVSSVVPPVVPTVVPVAPVESVAPIMPEPVVTNVPVMQEPPIMPVTPVQDQTPAPVVYASVWARAAAQTLDGLILSVPVGILSFVSGFLVALMAKSSGNVVLVTAISALITIIEMLIYVGYNVYFISKKGQTPGKMALKIKVVKPGIDSPLGFKTAVMRELLGKFVSGIGFSLGYLWPLWDPKKQAWHDKIAGTVVVKL